MSSGSMDWNRREPLAGDDESTQETVALLLDEVARLEAELRARDSVAPPADADATDEHDNSSLQRRVDELTAELAGRDETIGVLLEQARLLEERELAQREEWEQLCHWVEEVEQRVKEQEAGDATRDERLLAETRRNQELSRKLEAERAAWEAQKRRLNVEMVALRASTAGANHDADRVLQLENQRLRATCASLEHEAAAAAEVGSLRERLAAAQGELDRVQAVLRQERDDREREKNETEAAFAAIKSQLARASLQRATEPGARPVQEAKNRALDPDERIRAFRQHLLELHEQEQLAKASRGLSARISKLWKKTSPH